VALVVSLAEPCRALFPARKHDLFFEILAALLLVAAAGVSQIRPMRRPAA
jgi:hypothetical protein